MNKKVYIAGGITKRLHNCVPHDRKATLEKIQLERLIACQKLNDVGLEPINPFRGQTYDTNYSVNNIVLRDLNDLSACDSLLVLSSWPGSFGTICEIWEARRLGKCVVVAGSYEETSQFFIHCITGTFRTVQGAVNFLACYVLGGNRK